jgi:hypothetical protein
MTLGIVGKLGTGALLLYGIPFIIIVGFFSTLPLANLLTIDLGFPLTIAHLFAGAIALTLLWQDRFRPKMVTWLPTSLLVAFFIAYLISFVANLGVNMPEVRGPPAVMHRSDDQAQAGTLGRSREILHYARKRGLTGFRYAPVAKIGTPEFARGLWRHVREVRPDRADTYGPLARSADDRARAVAVVGATVPADDVRDGRVRARRDRGGGVGAVRLRAARAASIGQTHRRAHDRRARRRQVQRPGRRTSCTAMPRCPSRRGRDRSPS